MQKITILIHCEDQKAIIASVTIIYPPLMAILSI